MGNLWIPVFGSSRSSSPSSTRPSSPEIVHSTSNEGTTGSAFSSRLGIAQNTSNEGTHSGTGSAFSSRLDEISPNGQILPIAPTLKIFSFAELKKATRNFRPDAVVGGEFFGSVFKGWIDEKTFAPTNAGSGMAIAVRRLKSEDTFERWSGPRTPAPDYVRCWRILDSSTNEVWQTEVNILGSLSHPNIVRLLGHCEEDRERLLVYEFVPRGSLEDHLFRGGWMSYDTDDGWMSYDTDDAYVGGGSAFQPLSWSTLVKIAIGAAQGLAFLHCSERKIIHRDVTSSNVLIDSNYNAKISCFAFAMNCPPGEDSHVSTSVVGTSGYVDPEYEHTGDLSMKSDVYSFGVVLLEMLSGMRVLDRSRPREQRNLVSWAIPYLVMDRRLERQYPSKGAVLAARLTLKCLSPSRYRPSMTEVVEALEKIQAIKHDP